MKIAFVFTVFMLSLYGSNAIPDDLANAAGADSKEDPSERMLHMFKKPARKQISKYTAVPQIPAHDPYYSPCSMSHMAPHMPYMGPHIAPHMGHLPPYLGPMASHINPMAAHPYGDYGFGGRTYGVGPGTYGYNLPKYGKMPKKYIVNSGYGGFDGGHLPFSSPMFRGNFEDFGNSEPDA